MERDEIHELTAPYALDALDEEETREYEEHLGRCARCREELASLQDAATTLAYAVDAPAPPPALRGRILAEIRDERATVVPLRRRLPLVAAVSVAAAAVAVAIGLAIWASSLSSRLESEREARRDAELAASIISDPDAERIPLSGESGMLVVAPTGRAALALSDLEPAPEGKTYEAWVVEAEEPTPAGTFQAGKERTVVALTRRVPDGAVVAVTVERAGGVAEPTGRPLFTARTT